MKTWLLSLQSGRGGWGERKREGANGARLRKEKSEEKKGRGKRTGKRKGRMREREEGVTGTLQARPDLQADGERRTGVRGPRVASADRLPQGSAPTGQNPLSWLTSQSIRVAVMEAGVASAPPRKHGRQHGPCAVPILHH